MDVSNRLLFLNRHTSLATDMCIDISTYANLRLGSILAWVWQSKVSHAVEKRADPALALEITETTGLENVICGS